MKNEDHKCQTIVDNLEKFSEKYAITLFIFVNTFIGISLSLNERVITRDMFLNAGFSKIFSHEVFSNNEEIKNQCVKNKNKIKTKK